jgi:hypothetical protein
MGRARFKPGCVQLQSLCIHFLVRKKVGGASACQDHLGTELPGTGGGPERGKLRAYEG